MPMICMFRKMRYIPDMALAHMRTGCGQNNIFKIKGVSKAKFDTPLCLKAII